MNLQPMIEAGRASSLLNEWRTRMSISIAIAADLLGISDDDYIKYELGELDMPLSIARRCKQVETPSHSLPYLNLPRERWVELVDRASAINAGKPVIGHLVASGKWAELQDVMELARLGPNPQLALTDPKLFVSLREAGTKIYLTGIMEFPVPSPPFDRYPQPGRANKARRSVV